MRRAGSRSRVFVWWVLLYALGGCGGAVRPPAESHPAMGAPAVATCALDEEPARGVDTAAIVFHAVGMPRDVCALTLVAATLRPWPTPSNDRWTVEIVETEAGATAHRLRGDSARDVVDAGVTAIATEDLDLIGYAGARGELEVTPLPWDRTYLRLAPATGGPLGAAPGPDAVRVDARHAEPLPCDTTWSATAPATPRSTRVVYLAGDRTARELAERVVALMDGATAAVGLGQDYLDAALRTGDELAYVLSVARPAGSACDTLATLARRASWIDPHSIMPLIDTRAHAIAPRALPRGHPRP